MKPLSLLFLASVLSLILASVEVASIGEEDYLAAGGQLISPNYSPAFAGFAAVDMPLYLGSPSYPATVQLGRSTPSSADLAGARWYPVWPYNRTPLQMQNSNSIPYTDVLSVEAYHVPPIAEFLKPGYVPEGMNYTYHVPALGEFANQSWTPPEANYSRHVPAVGAFLSEGWQPSGPNHAYYPYWMAEFLQT
jgi:hypothetical protein